MKIKKLALTTLIVVGLLTVLATTALALTFDCIVTAVGPGGATGTYIKLTDTAATPTFTDRWFILRSDRGKEMLAVGLTAMANNKKVRAIMGSSAQWATINELYLLPN